MMCNGRLNIERHKGYSTDAREFYPETHSLTHPIIIRSSFFIEDEKIFQGFVFVAAVFVLFHVS